MNSNHVYAIERNLEGAKSRLMNCDAPPAVKEKIIEFVTFVKEANGIGLHREYFYYARLKVLAELMEDKILSPSKKEVINVISELRSIKTNRESFYSTASISDFKKVLKKFVSYVNDGDLPKFWKDIHAERAGPRYNRPSDMITYNDLQLLLKGCRNLRDKAIISLLWDSGVRASELLLLRIKDFQRSPDSLYATLNISVSSKSYKQRVVILTGDSVVIVSEFINETERDDDDFLFVGIGKERQGLPLNYEDLRMILRKVRTRSALNKKISPHLFRHSAATRMATENVPTQVFVKQMGWSSNRMADNYTHLDNKGQIIAILQSQGIEVSDDELNRKVHEVPRRCFRCHIVNTGGSRFCSNCGSPLLKEDFMKLEEQRQKVVKSLKEMDLVGNFEKKLLDEISPELQNELLVSILKDLKEKNKFHLLREYMQRQTDSSDS